MSLLRQVFLVGLALAVVLATVSASDEDLSPGRKQALVDYLENMINRAQRSGDMAAQKRGGVSWVWMPGQGYVQVPSELAANVGKSPKGKMMRYGRR